MFKIKLVLSEITLEEYLNILHGFVEFDGLAGDSIVLQLQL